MSTFTGITVNNFNDNPPTNDGTQDISSNGLDWDRHIDEIGTPLKTAIEALNTATDTGFDNVDLKTSVLIEGVGDGVTDDTTAIQTAINTGKTVHVPDGKVYLFTALSIPASTRFSGGGVLSGGAVTGSKPTRANLTGAANSTARLALLDAYYAATVTFTSTGNIKGEVNFSKCVLTSSTLNEINIQGTMTTNDCAFHGMGVSPLQGGMLDDLTDDLIFSDTPSSSIFCYRGGIIKARSSVIVSSGARGIYILYGGVADCYGGEIWNCTTQGIFINFGGSAILTGGTIDGCSGSGITINYSGTADVSTGTINGCANGIDCESNGTVYAVSANITGNTAVGVTTFFGGVINADSATITGNGTYGVYANGDGFISIDDATVDNTNTGVGGIIIRAAGAGIVKSEAAGGTGKATLAASNYDPPHNTVGNGAAYIGLYGVIPFNVSGLWTCPNTSTLTIASGVITPTAGRHKVAAETGTADQVDTITALDDGAIFILQADTGDTITVSEVDNINLGAATRVLDSVEDKLVLLCDGTNWDELIFADNG